MKVEMVKLNKVKIATSEEQQKHLEADGYQVLLSVEAGSILQEGEPEEADTKKPRKGSKKVEDSDGEGDAGQK